MGTVKPQENSASYDEEILKEHLAQMQDIVGKDVAIEFVKDNKLSDGQCKIETPYGVVDCGVDTQLSSPSQYPHGQYIHRCGAGFLPGAGFSASPGTYPVRQPSFHKGLYSDR